ncbi:MAG: peptidase [bacterium]|nr:peptidase [bacterium]
MTIQKQPSIHEAVKSLLTVNMGLEENENLLLLGDTADKECQDLAREVGETAQALHPATRTLIFDPAGGHGQEPPVEVWEAAFGAETVRSLEENGLLSAIIAKERDDNTLKQALHVVEKEGDNGAAVIVALTHFSTSHTTFRKLLNEARGVRYASMPLFEREMFFGSMNVDWASLSASTRSLAGALAGADRCEVRAPNGTEVVFTVSGRPVIPDGGILTYKRAFGNLPAGEVFMAPVEGTTEGTLVLDWGPLARFVKPLTVRIEAGRAVSVSGEDAGAVGWLEKALDAHPANANVAELGIGTNPGATRPDNVLESEKILGTVHAAFGDNHTFGGRTVAPFHQDFVIFDASLVGVWEKGGGRRVLLTEGRRGW